MQGIEELVTDKGYHSSAVVQRMKSYEVHSYSPEKKPKGRRNWQSQRAERAAGGLREPAMSARRVRQELTATVRPADRTQLRALLRDGWHAALPSARTREHSEAATGHVQAFNLTLILRKLTAATFRI